jgi:hypothetical protein
MLELTRVGGKIQVLTPGWAAPFVDLGDAARASVRTGRRRVYAALLPNRGFAATLVGLGAALSRSPDTSPDAQAWKRDLPPETECWYPVLTRFIRCCITDKARTDLYPLQVRTLTAIPNAPAGTTISVPPKNLSRLLPINPEDDGSGNRMNVKGRALVEKLYGKEESYAFYGERQLDVLICGVANDLCEESRFIEVCVDEERASALQLLRPRCLFGAKSGFRSEIVTSLQKPRPLSDEPQVVVFDGAYAYLQWGRVWKHATCIVILDESSPSQARLASAISRLHALRDRGTPIAVPPQRYDLMGVEL